MRAFLELIQVASFIGIIVGGFTLSHRSGLRHLWLHSLLICLASTLAIAYWEKIAAFFRSLFTWGFWGTVVVMIGFGAIKIVGHCLFGKRR